MFKWTVRSWGARCGILGVDKRLAATPVLVGLLAFAQRVAAQVPDPAAAVSTHTLTADRMIASVAAVVGLIGAVIGGLALARSTTRIRPADRQRRAIVALVMGPIGLVIGGIVVATAKGGLGTGHGLGGGILAMLAGVVGICLGGLALARSRGTA